MQGRSSVYLVSNRLQSQSTVLQELTGEPYETHTVPDVNRYFEESQTSQPACVLLEVSEDADSDLDAIALIHARHRFTSIIAFGNAWTVHSAVQAIKLGATDVCELNQICSNLKVTVRKAIQRAGCDDRRFHEMLPDSIVKKLSMDEARILQLFVQGRTTKEVGASLDVSIRTIHYRKKALLRKLGVANRSEAIELIRIANGATNLFGSPTI